VIQYVTTKATDKPRREEGSMDDRRIFDRIKASFPVRFLDPSNGREGKGETTDISANGLCFKTREVLNTKTPLELWLDIPDQHEPFYTRGRVAWFEPSVEVPSQRAGIRLEKAELMGLARILWLKKRGEAFKTENA